MSKHIIFLCAIIPTIYTQCTTETSKPIFKRNVYEFSLNLMGRIAQDNENHFVTSPLSAWSILSCASLGATGDTLLELQQVLKLHALKCFNNKYLTIANRATKSVEPDVFIERSSIIFADEKAPLARGFEYRINKLNISSIKNIQFNNVERAAYEINDYVSQATHNTLEEIVTANDLEDVLLVMIDALFFKGTWSIPFTETEKSAFYNYKREQIGYVNLMFTKAEFNIAMIPQIEAKVLELPYGAEKTFSMLLFLPAKGVTLSTVIAHLNNISLATIRSKFRERGPQITMVQIPRFKITSDLNNLRELLMDMGMKTAFDSNMASFKRLSEYPLHISNFIQKADIEVTEQGTVASAASAIEFGFRTLPEDFNANKPFLFMIINNRFEIPLFMGAYSKPDLS